MIGAEEADIVEPNVGIVPSPWTFTNGLQKQGHCGALRNDLLGQGVPKVVLGIDLVPGDIR